MTGRLNTEGIAPALRGLVVRFSRRLMRRFVLALAWFAVIASNAATARGGTNMHEMADEEHVGELDGQQVTKIIYRPPTWQEPDNKEGWNVQSFTPQSRKQRSRLAVPGHAGGGGGCVR